MADYADEVKSKLSQLNPAARARVEGALRETIEREVAGELGGPGGSARAFSRGIFFSKSGKAISLDELILPSISEMDEAKFATFMDRITALKKSNPGSGA